MEPKIPFLPYSDFVIVKQDELDQFTDGRNGVKLHRPWRVADWQAFGRVLAVGPGARHPETGQRVPIEGINVGDRVVWEWRPDHQEAEVNRICGPRTIALKADEIVGVVVED